MSIHFYCSLKRHPTKKIDDLFRLDAKLKKILNNILIVARDNSFWQ